MKTTLITQTLDTTHATIHDEDKFNYEMEQQKTNSCIMPQPPQAQSQLSRQQPKGSARDNERVPTQRHMQTITITEPSIIKAFGIRLELKTASATG